MTVERFIDLFHEYGLVLLFVVFFLEYMNLPGFPAGVIMPAAGVLVSQSELNLLVAVGISIVAGLLGSIAIYSICYYGGAPIAHKFVLKHEKMQKFVTKCENYINNHGGLGLAFCRIIPVLRTIVSIPAGLLRVPFDKFVKWSAIGISAWNTTLICAGYGASYLFVA